MLLNKLLLPYTDYTDKIPEQDYDIFFEARKIPDHKDLKKQLKFKRIKGKRSLSMSRMKGPFN